MPKALNPGVLFPIVLESDAGKPVESRPTFYVPALSMRQQTQLEEEMDLSLSHKADTKQLFEATCVLLSQYIKRWENMGPFVFGQSDVQEFLSYDEARELLRKVLANQHVTPDEKKD